MIGRSYPLPYPLVRLSSIVDRKLSRELLFFLKLNINFALKENLKEASFYILYRKNPEEQRVSSR